MKKYLAMAVIFGMILTLNAWAEDDALKEEIEDLKQRIEELEKKQETKMRNLPSPRIVRHRQVRVPRRCLIRRLSVRMG